MKITAGTEHEGMRLDAFLAAVVEDLSRNAAQNLIDKGAVLSEGGASLKKNHRMTPGEAVCFDLPEPEDSLLIPEKIALDVRYEDEDVIVVNKPKGMVVHPAPGHSSGTLVNALLYRCGSGLSGIGGEKRPGIVHRIDKDTSGLVIAAKTDFAHRSLSAQLASRSLSREYETIVTGHMKTSSGIIDAPIGRHPADRKKMAVTDKNSRRAVTHWQVIEDLDGHTHLRCALETGRTHQIRVHLAYIGHPVLGDTQYGSKRVIPGLDGQCLHAASLKFIHPRTGSRVIVECELPEYFLNMLRKFRTDG